MTDRFDRILVVGRPGSGKTRFSDRLGKLTGRKITHLDKYIWGSGWKKIPNQKQTRRKIMDRLTSTDRWVLDGHYLDGIEKRIEKADTVVLFDMPIWRSYYGLIKRSILDDCNAGAQRIGKRYNPIKNLKNTILSKKLRKTVNGYDIKFLHIMIQKCSNKKIYIVDSYESSNDTLNKIAQEINKSRKFI